MRPVETSRLPATTWRTRSTTVQRSSPEPPARLRPSPPSRATAAPVADAEAHLEETDLAEDRDTLKKLQSQM